MSPQTKIIATTTARLVHPAPEDYAFFNSVSSSTLGWSRFLHCAFFAAVLEHLFATQERPAILVCGVYRGLDLALIAGLAAKEYPGRRIDLHGVDLFSAGPCLDWPAEKMQLTWEQAFGCPPPSLEAAKIACPSASYHQMNSVEFLGNTAGAFDFIYLDTSHDEFTVRREIEETRASARPGLILAGDDYAGGAGQFENGVARALESLIPDHQPLFNRLWLAR